MVLIRVFLGLALQILSSYITFPLYTLVTQVSSLYINHTPSVHNIYAINSFFGHQTSDGIEHEEIDIRGANLNRTQEVAPSRQAEEQTTQRSRK